MKKIVRLSESQLIDLVKKVIKEQNDNPADEYIDKIEKIATKYIKSEGNVEDDDLEYYHLKIKKLLKDAKKDENITDKQFKEISDSADMSVKHMIQNFKLEKRKP